MKKKVIDEQDENLESLEDLAAEEEELEFQEDDLEASADFKALFDDIEDSDEDSDEEDFLDEEALSMDELEDLELDLEEDEDEDSLYLSEEESDEEESDEENSELEDYAMDSEEDSEEETETSLSDALSMMSEEAGESTDGTELEAFESAEIEELEFVDNDTIISVVESMLFSTDKPMGIATIKKAFEGTRVKSEQVRRAIEHLEMEYASAKRGISIEEVAGGYQLRTKLDNMKFLKRVSKGKPFKLSGPALEVLSIVAYKQPIVKAEVDEIRGVESGHLMRALMDRSLIRFAGKSELPGKPMYYETTRKFLEIFGLRNISELPSLSEIDDLIPEGIGQEEEKQHLSSVTDNMSIDGVTSYSEGADELEKIEETLGKIDTTTEFFEQEKKREKDRQDKMRAEAILESIEFGELVDDKDKKWLEKYQTRIIEEEEARKLAEEQRLEAEKLEAEAALNAESGEGSTENISTMNVDNSDSEEASLEAMDDFVDESDLLFAESSEDSEKEDTPSANEEKVEFVDESEELFMSENENSEEEEQDVSSKNLAAAFSNLSQAMDAFDKEEEGVAIDEKAQAQEEIKKSDKDLEI